MDLLLALFLLVVCVAGYLTLVSSERRGVAAAVGALLFVTVVGLAIYAARPDCGVKGKPACGPANTPYTPTPTPTPTPASVPPPSESSSRRPTLLQADVAWVSIGSADPPIEGYLSISCRATVSGELQASWEEPGVPDSQAKWSVARQGCDTVERVREAPYGLLKGRKRFPGLLRVRVCEPGVRSRGISHRRCSAPARVAVTGAQYYTPDQAERYYSRAER